MNRNIIKDIIYILIAILFGILAVKFIIWLLPIIVIAILSYLIYKSIKRSKVNVNVSTNNHNKHRKMKVIHELDDED